jgi:hypothetical protein
MDVCVCHGVRVGGVSMWCMCVYVCKNTIVIFPLLLLLCKSVLVGFVLDTTDGGDGAADHIFSLLAVVFELCRKILLASCPADASCRWHTNLT